MTKKIFLILIILIGLFLNNQAFAALVTCDPALPAGPGSCDLCALFETIQNVVNFLIGLAFSITNIMLVYGGIRMYFSGDNPGNRKTATNIVINAVIGLVIVLTSWVIINTIITFLAKPGSPPTFWTQLNCTPSELVEEPEECTENEIKCDGYYNITKCKNGVWEIIEECDGRDQKMCQNGECVKIEIKEGGHCDNKGQIQCINGAPFQPGYILKCSNSNVWEKIEDCKSVCHCRNNTECKESSPFCD